MTNIVPIHTVTSDYHCLHDILQKFFTLFATTNKEEKKLMPQTDPFSGEIVGMKTQLVSYATKLFIGYCKDGNAVELPCQATGTRETTT